MFVVLRTLFCDTRGGGTNERLYHSIHCLTGSVSDESDESDEDVEELDSSSSMNM